MAVLEEGWRSIVRDIGIEFQWEPALELFRKAGQTVEGDLVKLDPDFVLEQVAKAPARVPHHRAQPRAQPALRRRQHDLRAASRARRS